jgi:hypothetical protein
MTITNEEKENEWLQFMEFVKRKYGNNSSQLIRTNEYSNRGSRSVAEHYIYHHSSTVSPTAKLDDLLRNANFIELLGLNNPEEVSKFTEIYNDTDYLMKSLNTRQDNIYIKCNPVDDNGVSVEGSNNMYTQSLNSIDSVLTEGVQSFSPNQLYSNVGLQIFLCLIFIGIIYGVGCVIFKWFPSYMIKSKERTAPDGDGGANP